MLRELSITWTLLPGEHSPYWFPSRFEYSAVQQIKLLRSKPEHMRISHKWGPSEDTWRCLACSAGSRGSVPETGKESNSSVCHESPFPTSARANPAPLTRTWKGTDTILEVCAAESFSAIFILVRVHSSSCLWLQIGEVSTGRYALCHPNQSVAWNLPPS